MPGLCESLFVATKLRKCLLSFSQIDMFRTAICFHCIQSKHFLNFQSLDNYENKHTLWSECRAVFMVAEGCVVHESFYLNAFLAFNVVINMKISLQSVLNRVESVSPLCTKCN